MNSEDEAKWHWAEGIKFALEGIKLLFLLNGASAVSILTFTGKTGSDSGSLIWSMLSFAFGAAMTVPAMLFAYLTQLHYGNSSLNPHGGLHVWKRAGRMHYFAYGAIGLSITLFIAGALLAACGLFQR